MEFSSPRFQGDQHLLDILNDPDTGQVKLGPGSPAESVLRVQQALADLLWPAQTDPPLPVDGFADGVFGAGTERTVKAYKFVFRLRFPPGQSPSILDGFAGPRTMDLLDKHMVAFDAASVAIDERIADLTAAGSVITDQHRNGILTRTRITIRNLTLDGVAAALIHHPGLGVFLVRQPILGTYFDRFHTFGAPLGDEHDIDDATRGVDFQSGEIQVDVATGTVSTSAQGEPDLVY
ncbi:hypothetical protein [Amycolatopsis sp. NPDC021455]|uniref:hypothetical protein n=1 Tax=Amycolatopsis sp. NPDC021455 TaxID=3154901 RepID=UPI003410B6F0